MTEDPPFLVRAVYAVAGERQGADYYWDNRGRRGNRQPGRTYVAQLCRSGRAFIERDGKRHICPPGSAMLFSHGEASAYGNAEAGPYLCDWVAFGGTALDPIYQWLVRQHGPVAALPPGSEGRERFEDLLRRRASGGFRDAFHETALCSAFFLSLLSRLRQAQLEADPLSRAHDLFSERYALPITVDTVAAEVGLSREYLSRAYKRRYGEPPSRRLRRLRLEQADRLLATTTLPSRAIAQECGYGDPSAFVRAYRKARGHPPRLNFTSRKHIRQA